MDKIEEKNITVKKSSSRDFVFGLGRRKFSNAEVRLYKKDTTVWGGTELKRGEIVVNNKQALE